MKIHLVLPYVLLWLLAGLIWAMPGAARAQGAGRDAGKEPG